jgi:hypothetical protein
LPPENHSHTTLTTFSGSPKKNGASSFVSVSAHHAAKKRAASASW